MKQKEIFEVTVQITDDGVTYPLQSPIEVHPPVYNNVKKKLNKWRYSMDLSNKFKFEILTTKHVGYGSL